MKSQTAPSSQEMNFTVQINLTNVVFPIESDASLSSDRGIKPSIRKMAGRDALSRIKALKYILVTSSKFHIPSGSP